MLLLRDSPEVIQVAAGIWQSPETEWCKMTLAHMSGGWCWLSAEPPSTWSLIFKETGLSFFVWWKHQKEQSRSSTISRPELRDRTVLAVLRFTGRSKLQGQCRLSGREMDSLMVEYAKNLWTFLTYHRYLGINPTNDGQVDKTST